RRSSKGFAGTQLEFRSFEVRGLVLYRPAAKHCSNNIYYSENILVPRVSPEHMSRSTASTALEPEGCGCTHEAPCSVATTSKGPTVLAPKVSPEHNSSSAVLKLEAWCCTGQQPSIVAITYYNENIVAPRVSPEHMSRSAASTALEPEGCGCTH